MLTNTASSDLSLVTEDRMPFHMGLNLLYQTEHHSLKLEMFEKAKQEKKTLKAYYKYGQNQYNSSTEGQILLPLSSTCYSNCIVFTWNTLNSHHKNWECNLVLLPGITISLESFPVTHLHALSVLTKKAWRWDVTFKALLTCCQFCVYCHIPKLGRGEGLFIFLLLPCVTLRIKSPVCLLHFAMLLTLALFLCIQIWIGH